MLTFDEPTHCYRWDGQIVPSVTQALSLLTDFSMAPPDVLKNKQVLGTAVHKMIELDANNDLDEAGLTESLKGYLEAWRGFKTETSIVIESMEQKLFNPRYHYAGTYDLVGILQGERAVVDLKTSPFYPVNCLQTAAYLDLYNVNAKSTADHVTKRFSLHIRPDGTYRLEPHKDRNDFSVFLSTVSIFQWKRKVE